MVDRTSLESILSSLKGRPWSGRVFRVMLNDYPPDRENTQGARWNPPETAAIYSCLDAAVCIAEVEYGLARQSRPVKPTLRKTLYEIDLALGGLVELDAVRPQLADLGIDRPQLFADDMKVSQEIGRLVTWFGFDGLVVPSARSSGNNLVIYPGRATESYRFEIIGRTTL
jgi:RES domain-containing protein